MDLAHRTAPVPASGRCPHPTKVLSRRRLVPIIAAGLAAVSSLLRETPETTAKPRHRRSASGTSRRIAVEPVLPDRHARRGTGPLGGTWHEEAQFACGTGAELTPARPIGELRFLADGTLAVTWTPFEVYHDYFATYTADLAQGTLRFQASRGNYIPADLDGNGRITIDAQGRLLLTDLWLGSPRTTAGVADGPVGVATASARRAPDARPGGRAG